MHPKEKAKLLRAIAKEYGASEDVPFDISDFIDPSKKSTRSKAISARDLMEETLAEQVMRNTGVPVPDPKASIGKKEQFLMDILDDVYPEMRTNVRVIPDLMDEAVDSQGVKTQKPVLGMYFPETKKIKVRDTEDIHKILSTGLHEAAHQYDDSALKFSGTPDLLEDDLNKYIEDYKQGKVTKKLTPNEAYDILAKGHHAQIPGKREGKTFGAGALKSYLKSGKFKSLLPGVLTGGAGLVASGLAEAFDAEEVGRDSDSPSSDVRVTRNSPDPQLSRASEKETRMLEQFGTGEEVTMPEENPARKRMEQNMNAADNIKLKALQRILGK